MRFSLKPILVFSVFLSAIGASANHGKMFCGKMDKKEFTEKMAKKQDRFLRKLDLTEAQKTKVAEARAQHADRIYGSVQDIRTAHAELMASLGKDESRESLKSKADALGAKKQAFMSEKHELLLDIRDILTPQQRQKAVAKIRDKKEDVCD